MNTNCTVYSLVVVLAVLLVVVCEPSLAQQPSYEDWIKAVETEAPLPSYEQWKQVVATQAPRKPPDTERRSSSSDKAFAWLSEKFRDFFTRLHGYDPGVELAGPRPNQFWEKGLRRRFFDRYRYWPSVTFADWKQDRFRHAWRRTSNERLSESSRWLTAEFQKKFIKLYGYDPGNGIMVTPEDGLWERTVRRRFHSLFGYWPALTYTDWERVQLDARR